MDRVTFEIQAGLNTFSGLYTFHYADPHPPPRTRIGWVGRNVDVLSVWTDACLDYSQYRKVVSSALMVKVISGAQTWLELPP